jgi:hypothetical protein
MRPTTAFDDNVFDLNSLLHPGTMFEHPRDVVSHPNLSLAEKRAILAYVVPGGPGSRSWKRFARWMAARGTPRRQADAASIGRAARCGLTGEIAMDKATSRPNDISGQAIVRALQAQVQAWKAAKPDRRRSTDSGVPVVGLRRAQPSRKQA